MLWDKVRVEHFGIYFKSYHRCCFQCVGLSVPRGKVLNGRRICKHRRHIGVIWGWAVTGETQKVPGDWLVVLKFWWAPARLEAWQSCRFLGPHHRDSDSVDQEEGPRIDVFNSHLSFCGRWLMEPQWRAYSCVQGENIAYEQIFEEDRGVFWRQESLVVTDMYSGSRPGSDTSSTTD